MSRGLPSPSEYRYLSGPGAARPVGVSKRLLNRCPKCDAAPGHRCRRKINIMGGDPYWIPIKTIHGERKA